VWQIGRTKERGKEEERTFLEDWTMSEADMEMPEQVRTLIEEAQQRFPPHHRRASADWLAKEILNLVESLEKTDPAQAEKLTEWLLMYALKKALNAEQDLGVPFSFGIQEDN
jgi:hypothetical protein